MANRNSLEIAKKFYNKAIEEYKRAKEKKDNILFRDSAEKGWNAIVLATNYLIEKEENRKVRNNRERREILDRLEVKNGKFKRYKFYERFMARCHFLHELCFYDGIYKEDELERNLQKVKQYIKDVENVTKNSNM